jgi:hypothetical protein
VKPEEKTGQATTAQPDTGTTADNSRARKKKLRKSEEVRELKFPGPQNYVLPGKFTYLAV